MDSIYFWQIAKWLADGIEESGDHRRGSNWVDAWDMAWVIYREQERE